MTEFRVEGPVRGQGRPRFAGRRAYKAAADAAWERKIARAYEDAGGVCLDGPVAVVVDVFRSLPPSLLRKRVASEPDTHRPDADNVAKGVLDALNGLAFRDDAQVTVLRVTKHDREARGEWMRVRVMGVGEHLAREVRRVGRDLDEFDR